MEKREALFAKVDIKKGKNFVLNCPIFIDKLKQIMENISHSEEYGAVAICWEGCHCGKRNDVLVVINGYLS